MYICVANSTYSSATPGKTSLFLNSFTGETRIVRRGIDFTFIFTTIDRTNMMNGHARLPLHILLFLCSTALSCSNFYLCLHLYHNALPPFLDLCPCTGRILCRLGYRVWYDKNEMGHRTDKSMATGILQSKVNYVCMQRICT
jgi:hypothetical protein